MLSLSSSAAVRRVLHIQYLTVSLTEREREIRIGDAKVEGEDLD